MMITAPNLFIKNATLRYQGTLLFDSLTFTIPAGKTTCLLGPSGVGKTTLLQMIAGLIRPNESVNNTVQGDITCDNTMPLHSQIAYLAQTDSLLPWLNAYDNALLGFHLRGQLTESIKEKTHSLFQQVGLEGAQEKFPNQLSGGMRQRIALIRTFIEEKSIILMDEPFSALDAITRFQLQALTVELLKNKTVFLVTHDPLEALRMADFIYILAGCPATIQNTITLSAKPPREIDHPEIVGTQALLFRYLTSAKEMQRCPS